MPTRGLSTVIIGFLIITCAPAAADPPCVMGWSREFAPRGVLGGVHALITFDDGTGPALYVGGNIGVAGEAITGSVARWDGQRWASVGDGPTCGGTVQDLAVFDDGTGPGLYAGGRFDTAGEVPVSNLARWDGHRWSDVGGGVYGFVSILEPLPTGEGMALLVGGFFTSAGSMPAQHVAIWDGE